MKHLGDMHRELGIPTDAYPMIGMSLIATLKPFSEQFAEMTKGTDMPVTQERARTGLCWGIWTNHVLYVLSYASGGAHYSEGS